MGCHSGIPLLHEKVHRRHLNCTSPAQCNVVELTRNIENTEKISACRKFVAANTLKEDIFIETDNDIARFTKPSNTSWTESVNKLRLERHWNACASIDNMYETLLSKNIHFKSFAIACIPNRIVTKRQQCKNCVSYYALKKLEATPSQMKQTNHQSNKQRKSSNCQCSWRSAELHYIKLLKTSSSLRSNLTGGMEFATVDD